MRIAPEQVLSPTRSTTPPTSQSHPIRDRAAALALFVLLAVAHTWPLASAPQTLSRNDNGDTVLIEWILAWDAHQIAHDPWHLFDANIFYPEKRTLAYSDHLLAQAALAAPVLWAGGSPVLTYNLLLIAGFALTGWTACLVVRKWTGSWLAGVLSGSLMAFNAFTLTLLPHLQEQHLEFFPLALLALDRVVAQPRVKDALALTGWFVLQALTSGYLLVFSSICLVAAAIVRPEIWSGASFRRRAPYLAGAAAVAGVLLLPFLLPYRTVSIEQGLVRGFNDVLMFSATFTDYLATGGRIHFDTWSRRFFRGNALFPGVVGFALAVAAVASGAAVRDLRARMVLAFGIVAFVLSFGPKLPLYAMLYYAYPLMRGIRGAARFGQFVLAAVAILAGFGLVALVSRVRRPAAALALALAAIAAVNLEALRAPLGYAVFGGIPRLYRTLSAGDVGVVACLPLPPRNVIFQNKDCMLASTLHWKPMLNGYSGFTPASYNTHLAALAQFPSAESIAYLRRIGVTHVAIASGRVSPDRAAAIDAASGLSLYAGDATLRIYRVK